MSSAVQFIPIHFTTRFVAAQNEPSTELSRRSSVASLSHILFRCHEINIIWEINEKRCVCVQLLFESYIYLLLCYLHKYEYLSLNNSYLSLNYKILHVFLTKSKFCNYNRKSNQLLLLK